MAVRAEFEPKRDRGPTWFFGYTKLETITARIDAILLH